MPAKAPNGLRACNPLVGTPGDPHPRRAQKTQGGPARPRRANPKDSKRRLTGGAQQATGSLRRPSKRPGQAPQPHKNVQKKRGFYKTGAKGAQIRCAGRPGGPKRNQNKKAARANQERIPRKLEQQQITTVRWLVWVLPVAPAEAHRTPNDAKSSPQKPPRSQTEQNQPPPNP